MPDRASLRLRSLLPWGALAALVVVAIAAEPAAAQSYATREYGDFPVIGSRAAIWIAAQLLSLVRVPLRPVERIAE